MRIICNDKDLALLELHGAITPKQLLVLRDNLAQNLSWICEAVPNEVSLDNHGPIFLLEPGDNTRGMTPAGIPSHIGGLLGVIPEYVDEVNLDNKVYWKALVVLGNSYAPTYWVPLGMDPEVDQHLAKYLEPASDCPKSPSNKQLHKDEADVNWI